MSQLIIYAVLIGMAVNYFQLGFLGVILCVLGLGVLFIYSLYAGQEQLLYQRTAGVTPAQNPPRCRSPSEYALPFDNVYLETPDKVRLHVWFLRQAEHPESCPTLLFCHANAGNMGLWLPNLNLCYKQLRCNVVVFSYRGYGESRGAPNEFGICIDVRTVFNWMLKHEQIDNETICVLGRSLGGAVAAYLAADVGALVRAVVLENTFTSVSDLVDTLFPFLKAVKGLILRLRWETRKRIGKIEAPILFMSSLADEIVPAAHMDELYKLATTSQKRTIARFPGATHNDLWIQQGYYETLRSFLQEHIPECDFTPLEPLPPLTVQAILAAGIPSSKPSLTQVFQGSATETTAQDKAHIEEITSSSDDDSPAQSAS